MYNLPIIKVRNKTTSLTRIVGNEPTIEEEEFTIILPRS